MLYQNEWEVVLTRKHTVSRGARSVRVEITAKNMHNSVVLTAFSYDDLDKQIKKYDDGINASVWSDMYKDVYGVRPHHKYEWWVSLTREEQASEMRDLALMIEKEERHGYCR